jgi:Rieske Fe-S protein
LRKIAVYRDSQNELHRFSAECPHLKGILHWNSSEKSWDCPCHGSRFDKFGHVLNGPATEDMTPISEMPLTPVAEVIADHRGFTLKPEVDLNL